MHQVIIGLQLQEAEKVNKVKTNLGSLHTRLLEHFILILKNKEETVRRDHINRSLYDHGTAALVMTKHFSVRYMSFWFLLLGKFLIFYTEADKETSDAADQQTTHTVSCGTDFLFSLQS